ncbi:TPA: ATP-binding cassette domain-containing protein [Bacillus cereus]
MSEFKHITYIVDDVLILDRVTIEISSNSLIAIVGPNGAGKTTLIEILADIKGKEMDLPLRKIKKIVYLNQNYLVYEYLKVNEYVKLIGYINNLSNQFVNTLIEDFKALAIEQFWNTKIKDLSLGQKQKVLVMTGLVSNPEILLFDEPFNGLDITSYEYVLQLFRKYQQEFSIVFSTHKVEGLSTICDSVIFLKKGKVKKQLIKKNGDLKDDKELYKLFKS